MQDKASRGAARFWRSRARQTLFPSRCDLGKIFARVTRKKSSRGFFRPVPFFMVVEKLRPQADTTAVSGF